MAKTKETNLPKLLVAINDHDRVATKLFTRNHQWLADEEGLYGGEDQAPDPFDLVLSAVAACTAMSVRSLARRKKWPLDRVSVEILFDRIQGKNSAFKKVILRGDLSDSQVGALSKVAGECPTQKLVSGPNLSFFTEIRMEKSPVHGLEG